MKRWRKQSEVHDLLKAFLYKRLQISESERPGLEGTLSPIRCRIIDKLFHFSECQSLGFDIRKQLIIITTWRRWGQKRSTVNLGKRRKEKQERLKTGRWRRWGEENVVTIRDTVWKAWCLTWRTYLINWHCCYSNCNCPVL